MAENSDFPPIDLQIPGYGQDAARWQARSKALQATLQFTEASIRSVLTETETAVSQWKQEHSYEEDKLLEFEKTLAELGDLLDGAIAGEPKDGLQKLKKLFEFTRQMVHGFIPLATAYQTVQECSALLRHLQHFSTEVFTFFDHQFYSQAKASPDKPAENLRQGLAQAARAQYSGVGNYAADSVMTTLLEQSSIDLTLIKQIFHERYTASRLLAGAKSDPQQLSLIVADQLAELAMQPAHQQGFLAGRAKRIRTYLNRHVEVRLLPYHDIKFVGIPDTAQTTFSLDGETLRLFDDPTDSIPINLDVPTSYLAIPHEVGHHLYWYGQVETGKGRLSIHRALKHSLREQLAQQPTERPGAGWQLRWAEEIFADVYSCLVAGPITLLGFLERVAVGQPVDDNKHTSRYPTNVLRPLIQCNILHSIRNQSGSFLYEKQANLLEAYWQQWVKTHWLHWVETQWPNGYSDQTDVLRNARYAVDGKTLGGCEILDGVQVVVDVCLGILDKLRPASIETTWTPTWQPGRYTGSTDQKVTKLYKHFVIFAFTKTVKEAIDLYRHFSASKQPNDKIDQTWLLQRLAQLRKEPSSRPSMERLIDLLLFEGWSTEGPDGNPIKKD